MRHADQLCHVGSDRVQDEQRLPDRHDVHRRNRSASGPSLVAPLLTVERFEAMNRLLALSWISVTGCGLLAGLEGVPVSADGGVIGPGSGPGGTTSDASDPIVVPPGYIQCGTTSQTCDLAGGQECCVNLYGTAASGTPVYNDSIGTCEVISGPNCGEWGTVGEDFMDAFAQTCAATADCDAGYCCGHIADAGAGSPAMLGPIMCATQAACASSGLIVCKADNDCPSGQTCVAEADPLLAHLWTHRCSP
jgi:hypothetical protein